MKLYWMAILCALLIVVGLIYHWMSGPTLVVTHPARGTAVQAVYATGTVEATVMMPIATRITAKLIALNADEGSRIQKGQVLATLEDTDLQNTVRQLKAQEDYTRKEYERHAVLVKAKAISKAAYDHSKSDWEAAKAASAKAIAEAEYTKLTAPADGLIIKRDGEIGQLIATNTPVFWISCCAPLRISAEVDEEDIAQIAPGQTVLIRADAFPGEIFHGKVQAITPKGDPIARSYRVRIGLTESTPLQIGMTAETNIIIGEHTNALLVPSSAVSQNQVWLVKEGRLVYQRVTVGAKGAQQTEIMAGLTEEDLVVTHPDANLQPKQRVKGTLQP